ncbi:MAG: YcxB family protein [Pirellulaceae bacterium]|nr:YcxB family protein [Planctomycetales bacterium]
MKATYELTRDDLVAFIEFHQRTSPAARRQKIGCLVVAFCALMVLPAGILLTTDKPVLETATDICPLLLGPILFGIFAIPYIRWRTRQMSNRLLSEGQNKEFYGKCELEAGDAALTETRPSGSTTRNWTSVERIVIMPSHLFVYTSGIEAYVVPRRAFSTESEFNAFVDVLTERSAVEVQACG